MDSQMKDRWLGIWGFCFWVRAPLRKVETKLKDGGVKVGTRREQRLCCEAWILICILFSPCYHLTSLSFEERGLFHPNNFFCHFTITLTFINFFLSVQWFHELIDLNYLWSKFQNLLPLLWFESEMFLTGLCSEHWSLRLWHYFGRLRETLEVRTNWRKRSLGVGSMEAYHQGPHPISSLLRGWPTNEHLSIHHMPV